VNIYPIRELAVGLRQGAGTLPLGRLAWVERQILFEFDKGFPVEKLNPSPFQLQERSGSTVIPGPGSLFGGLHGVFNDSLPDGWGLLLMDRKLRSKGIVPGELTPLDRLAWIGGRGMGALVYCPAHPALFSGSGADRMDLDHLAAEALLVLEGRPEVVLDQLLRAGGSPAGARPKALVGRSREGARLVHGEEALPDGFDYWLVKFGAQDDPPDIGAIEQAYASMARKAGVVMPDTALFPSRRGPGYFGAKRFDRGPGGVRTHMVSLSGLLHADHRLPSIGYEDFLKATLILTRNHAELAQAFTRMAFNVYGHNRDDHSKNHGFLMDEAGRWTLSPAFDMVYCPGPGGEHSMDVAGEGRAPGVRHLLKVAEAAGLPHKEARLRIDRVKTAVGEWPSLAREHDVSADSRERIHAVLKTHLHEKS
jgi:serine/threonine-protein kinase HipA